MRISKTSIFDVLVCPILTYKALRILEYNQYSFFVTARADKNSIKNAIEQFFGVEVLAVTTCTRPVKKQRFQLGGSKRSRGRVKRAVVKLAPESTLPFLK